MKRLFSNFAGDVIAAGVQELGTASAAVEKAPDGVPLAWRLFKWGPFAITKEMPVADGAKELLTLSANFTREHGNQVMDYAKRKGNRLPIDSEHGLALLASAVGVDEAELLPLLNRNRVILGMGSLALRADGLWVQDVDWLPLARKVIAQKVLQYFSPMLRGLTSDRMRITSISMLNTPAIDQLDAIAASAIEDDTVGAPGLQGPTDGGKRATPPTDKGASMKGLLAKLGALIGLAETDALALTAETAEAAILPKLEPLLIEVPQLRATKAAHEALLGALRTGLALGAETPPEAVKGHLLAFLEKAKGDAVALTAVSARVQALETAKATADRQALIDRGLAEGKLTAALVASWAKDQDVAALTAFLGAAPVIVQPGRQTDPAKLQHADSLALTADEEKIARNCGNDPKAVKEAWKKHTGAG